MKIYNKPGSKERLLEMFEGVNKIKVNEPKKDKKIIKENFPVGTRVKVSDGSGLDSNKVGTVVDRSVIKTDERGVPDIQGHYKPVDWSKETVVQYLQS